MTEAQEQRYHHREPKGSVGESLDHIGGVFEAVDTEGVLYGAESVDESGQECGYPTFRECLTRRTSENTSFHALG
jgi:hypothetical protein